MSNPNFKQEFEQSLQRLAQINTAILVYGGVMLCLSEFYVYISMFNTE